MILRYSWTNNRREKSFAKLVSDTFPQDIT
jgi:hypothetical protein